MGVRWHTMPMRGKLGGVDIFPNSKLLYSPLDNHLLPMFASFSGFHLTKMTNKITKNTISINFVIIKKSGPIMFNNYLILLVLSVTYTAIKF